MYFLLIETSTEQGLLAYAEETIISVREWPFVLGQSRELMTTLTTVLPIDAATAVQGIAVGIGPGSYTGIRLGVSVAQALSYAWQIPLVGVSTLSCFIPKEPQDKFAVLMDARRGAVYAVKRKYVANEAVDIDQPVLIPLTQVEEYLDGIDHVVSPHAHALQTKLAASHSPDRWRWEQSALSPLAFLQTARMSSGKIGVCPPLLYLQATEAEKMSSKIQRA